MINLGHSKSWTAAYLDVDVDPESNPDLLADISDPDWLDKAFVCHDTTTYNGSPAATTTSCVTDDVLERVATCRIHDELPRAASAKAWERARRRAQQGLSYGAWQDLRPRARLEDRAELALLRGLALV